MKQRVLSLLLILTMLLTLAAPFTAFAEGEGNTFNGSAIPFSDWAQAGFGAWEEADGVLKPTEITEYSLLRLEYDLGQNYTIDMDVRQIDTTSGWQTINIGFDVNVAENFTQSGLVLDLHNAGVFRVITFANKNMGGGVLGSYDNPYGGTGPYTPTTDWFHVRFTRSGSSYAVTVGGTTLSFQTNEFNGGYLVLGSVGNREVNYKNIKITTSGEQKTTNTFDGEEIPFTDWTACGEGGWKEEDGILKPTEITEFSMLRFEKALGETYTIDMDVRQLDTTSGWQTINIGFDVNEGENFTQSGLVLDMHNAGVCRVITFADKDKSDGTFGSYGNPYGGNGSYTPTTAWAHVQIVRSGSNYAVTVNNAKLTFKAEGFNGGYLVLGSVGSREVNYKNVTIKTEAEVVPDPPTPIDPTDASESATTFNGEKVAFVNWQNAAFGNWTERQGVIYPENSVDFAILRFNQNLGNTYTIEFDLKQEDNTSGWNDIQFGFEVNAGENFTQSGLMVDLHNLGFTRIIHFPVRDDGPDVLGSYDNPYGGSTGFSGTTEWIHVKLMRSGNNFLLNVNDGKQRSLTFASEEFNGGYFCIASDGFRKVSYKNINIKTEAEDIPDPVEDVTGSATTYNGKKVPFSNWTNAAFGSWEENDGVISPESTKYEFAILRFNKNLGSSYTVEFDVKQTDNYSGWNTIQFGFEVNAGENFTQSGLLMEFHNLGFGRVINFATRDGGVYTLGSYDNPYGGVGTFSGKTGWMHVKVARSGNTFKVSYNDGTPKKLIFTTDKFNGGYFCIASNGNRKISYRNIVIDTVSKPDVSGVSDGESNYISKDRAVYKETESGLNTFNGEKIPASHWSNAGFTPWVEINGIMTPTRLTDFGLWRYDRDLGDTYTIDLDVKQADVSSGWNTIQLGFDVNAGQNFTESGLTLDLHNAGIARVIDFTKQNDKTVSVGSYDRPFGGSVDYSATTEWIHIKIQRLKSYYTVTINDGTVKVIRFETEDYNGGHLVIGAVGNRDVIYKNITIIDDVVAITPEEPTYPENIGMTAYSFDGNKYGEWVPTDESVWQIDGTTMLQTSEAGEQTIYYDREELRNFKLTLNYDLLSENGIFGISFRKKTGSASYQGIGYSLIFDTTGEENTMTFADYSTSGATSLDGFPHAFGSAGSVEITASGNEFCVWLDDELIINVTNNAYAFGTLALFTVDCSVEFSDVRITADGLLSDEAWDIIDAFHNGDELTQEHLAAYEALDDFQKALFPNDVKRALEQIGAPEDEPDEPVDEPEQKKGLTPWVWAPISAGVLGAGAVIIAVLVKKRKKQEES